MGYLGRSLLFWNHLHHHWYNELLEMSNACLGYGDFTTVTVWGKIFTMIYAIIGIPVVITILTDWGTIMFQLVNRSVLWVSRHILPIFRWLAIIWKPRPKKSFWMDQEAPSERGSNRGMPLPSSCFMVYENLDNRLNFTQDMCLTQV